MANIFSKLINKIKTGYENLPQKKQYIEFFSALLTIPMLVTVILINMNNLKSKEAGNPSPSPAASVPTATPLIIVEQTPANSSTKVDTSQSSDAALKPTSNPTQSGNLQCQPKVGPVEITAPAENELITKNPVCIGISNTEGNYCSLVWSYRLGNDAWSDYSSNTICLYNLTPGTKNLEVKVRSVASSDEVLLKRTFTVPGSQITPAPTSTASAQMK